MQGCKTWVPFLEGNPEGGRANSLMESAQDAVAFLLLFFVIGVAYKSHLQKALCSQISESL